MFLLSQAALPSSGVLHKPNSALKPLTADGEKLEHFLFS